MARSSSEPRGRVKKWLIRGVKIGLVGFLSAAIAVVVAVVIAYQSLPDYESLKSSPNGQMIRVHAADGRVIVSLGPSFGPWLSYAQIPTVLVDAMVSTDDNRYYLHPVPHPLRLARAPCGDTERPGRGRP